MSQNPFYNQQQPRFIPSNNSNESNDSNGHLNNNLSRLETSSVNAFGLAVIQMFQLFYYYTQSDDNFYNVMCRPLQDFARFTLDDYDFDHGFFYQNSVANYYVTCKLLSRASIVHILNRNMFT